MKNKRVLVTGSSGFVGKHLVARLKEECAEVITFDKSNGDDITKWEEFKKLGPVDIVYHLAAITFVPFSQKNPRLTNDVNIQGTANVLDFCRLNNAKLIFASSYIYGAPKSLPIDELHPVQPTNVYATSKVIGEMLCKSYHNSFGLKCIILRPFNIFGQGQSEDFLIPYLINQLKTKSIVTVRDLTPKRDFIYISDVIDAYIKAAEYEGSNFEIFNVGSGISFSVKSIVTKLINISKRTVKVKSLNEKRKGEIMNTVADIRKIKKILSWEPSISFDQGLERLFNKDYFSLKNNLKNNSNDAI